MRAVSDARSDAATTEVAPAAPTIIFADPVDATRLSGRAAAGRIDITAHPGLRRAEIGATVPGSATGTDAAWADCVADLESKLAGVVFSFGVNEADLSAEHRDRLPTVVEQVAACPSAIVEIVGHSDRSGTPAVNLEISWERAEAVMEAIFAEGYDTRQFRVRGMGSREPKIEGTGPDAQAQNRRVEFGVRRAFTALGQAD